MRFTVHRAAKGPQAREFAEAMEREARKCIQTSSVGWHQVNNVKTLCVLVDYMASYGHGRQAWMDIDCELEMEQTQALTIAERYLTIAQASHCLGHRHLQPSHSRQTKRPRLECAPCPEDCPHLVELLEVLACIHQLCLVPFREQNPLPWTPDSEFRALQDELEEYLLRHPSTFRFGSNSPSAQPSRLGDLDASISSIIWHCCVIVLNRNFLPIPERRPNPAADGALYPPARSLDFPEAPPLFLKERIYRCESSADAICDISQDIIRNGGFYSHALFVGYACTQSALVSINRIHRSPKPYDGRIVDNLKLAFVILGALQPFYTPAQEWMNLLFRAHDTNYASEISDHSFDNYFSRFLNIEEPTFMPLQPKTSDTTSEDNEGDGEHGRTKHVQNEEEERADETVPANSAPEWLQAYAGHLSGDIESDDEESPDESPRSSGVHIGPIPTQGTNAMTQMVPLDNPGEGQDRMNMGMGGGTSEILPVHMAGAILTSMSGGAPSFPLHAQEHRHQQLVHTEYDEQCMAMDNQTEFPGLFSQMPTFADFSELGPEIPIFPGLESVVGESDMWSDIFHNNMFE
ncbi:fungal-specific transcription factor domain-containing protein [Penicillium paradoxum]|uniref:fungal-specific transcription factor domain-containing protein n=1 Tax=Penicillium paradoxum TaxID=176176 RepID=UPI00254938A2|nr:fungal-specific transcription factor domain-containing protein [Penicillium paradoxum]KAJ5788305.1 fungal-specific transcription factor domain-containing protein [Penicillium paradoxum]